jgi:hypothetical protein
MMLRAQIATPTHVARLTALGIAFAGAGLFAIAKPALETPAQQGTPTIAIASPSDTLLLDVPVASQTDAPPIGTLSSRSVAMVFTAQDSTWMKLENVAVLGEDTDSEGVPRIAMPKHGEIRHTREKWVEIAIAPLALEDVPAMHRERLGDKIMVDGTCTAYITGFAVVARLVGSPGYAGDDTSDEWRDDSVLRNGEPMIAARLDNCDGTLARDATLPPAATPRRVKDVDAKLVAKARRMLIHSAKGAETAKAWSANQDTRSTWDAEATWKTDMFVHPTTHETWISIHAHTNEGCGAPFANVWGLYRVEKDHSLTAMDVDLGDIEQIDQLIDFDGDGMWEVVGDEWLGEKRINDAKGNALDKLQRPFYGCPC